MPHTIPKLSDYEWEESPWDDEIARLELKAARHDDWSLSPTQEKQLEGLIHKRNGWQLARQSVKVFMQERVAELAAKATKEAREARLRDYIARWGNEEGYDRSWME